jgi:hypothetical protein
LAVAIGLAACAGPNSPHVASLGKSGPGKSASTTTIATGSPAQLLDKWAACMRVHGDPNQIDPIIDVNKVIQVTLPEGYTRGLGGAGPHTCSADMTAAQTALRGGEPPATSDQATALKFAQCMRANGIADFPDPTGNQQAIRATPGSDLDPADPAFQAASTLCANKTGFQKFASSSTPQPGAINLNMAGGFGGKPGGNGGPAANTGANDG